MRSPDEVLALMTLEEKASLLTGDSAWTTSAIPRLDVPALRMADGPHGVRRTQSTDTMAFGASPATCFPTASATSATWDPDLVRDMGDAIAEEAIALGVDVVLGPGVNMKRSPLCGRNFEYFAEDPYLAGVLATAWIDGIQSRGVGASLKHFAVNNQETRRMTVSAEVDDRTLREIYLPAFEAAVRDARPWTVMCAYNRINGTYASEHRALLTEVLRREWGFSGAVMSDWAAVHDRPRAVAAGLDLEMPGPRPRRVRAVIDAVASGSLSLAAVDASALRILTLIEQASKTTKGGAFEAAEHHALARRIAADGMVLLKNDGLLPLSPGGSLAVIGRAAKVPSIQGGGSSQITSTRIDIPLAELERAAGAGTAIVYVDGYDDAARRRADLIEEAVIAAQTADAAVVFVASPGETEGGDRSDIDLTPHQAALIEAVGAAQPRTVVVIFSGSAVSMPWVDSVGAVVEAWLSGQAAGGAIADILFGLVNPSGRLAESFPIRLEDTPAFLNFPGEDDRVSYGEGLYIGYRWYDARRLPVLFPFGHGLSYTRFSYEDASCSHASSADGAVTVSIDVANTGDRAGSEVVQLYVRPVAPTIPRPYKELRRFRKVHLAAGETQTVTFALDSRAFAHWDVGRQSWDVEAGRYEILLGASSADIRGVVPITIEASPGYASRLTATSPLHDWLVDDLGRPAAAQLLRTIGPIIGHVFGHDPDHPDAHSNSYFGQMPIRDVLEFAAASGGPDPEEQMAILLASLGHGFAPTAPADEPTFVRA